MPDSESAQEPLGGPAVASGLFGRDVGVLFVVAEIGALAMLISPLALGSMFALSAALVMGARIVPERFMAGYFAAAFAGLFAFVYFLPQLVDWISARGNDAGAQPGRGAVALGASYCYLRAVYAIRERPASLWEFARYYFFLPTFFIGPILAPDYFSRQKLQWSVNNLTAGLALVAAGLSRFVLSGILAQLVPHASGAHMALAAALQSPFEMWLASVLAGFWLYLNFSGMSLVAIGAARVLGIVVPPNFNNPFAAASLADFWRRWHITLGDWLRTNVFNPAARFLQQRGLVRVSLFIPALVTMVFCGLWHEVTLPFVIWGALHGAGLAINGVWSQYVSTRMNERYRASPAYTLACWFVTQAYVVATWSFFFPLPSSLTTSGNFALGLLHMR